MNNNITAPKFKVDRKARNSLMGHRSFVIWFTGLSGSGKSTIANEVEVDLIKKGIHTFILDGDKVRLGLNRSLGFNKEDRHENLRRIAEVAKLFVDSGIVVLASFVSPLKSDRDMVKNIIGPEDYVEIFMNTPLEECERRDVKGLYKKARAGKISNFTGIDSPYEPPVNPHMVINGKTESIEKSKLAVLDYLKDKLDLKKND